MHKLLFIGIRNHRVNSLEQLRLTPSRDIHPCTTDVTQLDGPGHIGCLMRGISPVKEHSSKNLQICWLLAAPRKSQPVTASDSQ